MKKTILTLVIALFAIAAFAQNEENKSYIPNGYQGFLEENNCWHFDKEMPTTIQLSTTHGFYFNDHIYAGIGVGLEFNPDYVLMPIYTNVRYVFLNKKAVSPFVSMRLGSYVSDNNVGAYGDLALGVRFSSKKDFAVSVMVAGTYYDDLHYSYYYDGHYDEHGELHYEYTEKNISPSGISLRVGIEW